MCASLFNTNPSPLYTVPQVFIKRHKFRPEAEAANET